MLELIESDGLSIGGGPPYFVTSLLDHPELHARAPGATSRPSASAGRRCRPRSPGGWPTSGSSCSGPTAAPSIPSITGSRRRRARGQAAVHRRQRPARRGDPARTRRRDLQSRTRSVPGLHRRRADRARPSTHDGWYRTGDVGVLDDDGYLTITDRKADVIIRGGENISALEVEEVLLTHARRRRGRRGGRARRPARRARGRRAAGQSRARPCRRWTRCATHFERAGVAKQKWPEELHEVDDFPRTASGKVQKFLVRQNIRREPGSTLRCAASENRILPRGKGVFHGPTVASGRHTVSAVRRGQPPVRAAGGADQVPAQGVQGRRPVRARSTGAPRSRCGSDQQLHPQPHLRGGRQAGRVGGVLQVRQPRRQEQARAVRRADAVDSGVLRAGSAPGDDGRARPRPLADVPDAGQPDRGAAARRPGRHPRHRPRAQPVARRGVGLQLPEPHLHHPGDHPAHRREGDRGAGVGGQARCPRHPDPPGAGARFPRAAVVRAARVRSVLGAVRRVRRAASACTPATAATPATPPSGTAPPRRCCRSRPTRCPSSTSGARSRTRWPPG